MRARGFTHVSVHAYDLEESARFYREVFGMEEIPAPNFSSPVRWLRVGDLQLNLVEVNWPDVTTLDRTVVTGIVKRDVPQTGDALRATLYLRKDRASG